jgi:hypothetical protein
MKLLRYDDMMISENKNLERELLKIGYTENQLEELFHKASKRKLGHFLHSKGKNLTFGLLKAIYDDSIEMHRSHEFKRGSIKALVRAIPIALGPISALVSYIGMALGSTRAVNKILKPIIEDPSNSYPDFLKKLVSTSMDIAEGETSDDNDPIKLAFVVSDGIVDMLKESTILEFTVYLAEKMGKEPENKQVPNYYIENELRRYVNGKFKLNPPFKMKR